MKPVLIHIRESTSIDSRPAQKTVREESVITLALLGAPSKTYPGSFTYFGAFSKSHAQLEPYIKKDGNLKALKRLEGVATAFIRGNRGNATVEFNLKALVTTLLNKAIRPSYPNHHINHKVGKLRSKSPWLGIVKRSELIENITTIAGKAGFNRLQGIEEDENATRDGD